MEIGFLLTLVVVLVAVWFAFKLVKSLLKAVMVVAVLLAIVIVAAGFFVMNDVKDLRENFSNSTKLVLFAGEERIAFGLDVTSFDAKGVKILDRSVLDAWEEDYERGKYKTIRGDDYYKLFVIKDDKYNEPVETLADHMDLLEDFFSEGNVRTLLVKHRTGELVIYPETAVFKLMKVIPEKWVMKLDKSDAEEESD